MYSMDIFSMVYLCLISHFPIPSSLANLKIKISFSKSPLTGIDFQPQLLPNAHSYSLLNIRKRNLLKWLLLRYDASS